MATKRLGGHPYPSRNTRSKTSVLVSQEDPMNIEDNIVTQTHHLSREPLSVEENISQDVESSITFSNLEGLFISLKSLYGIETSEVTGGKSIHAKVGPEDITRLVLFVGSKAEEKARAGELTGLTNAVRTIMRNTEEIRRENSDLGSRQGTILSKLTGNIPQQQVVPITTATIPSSPLTQGAISMMKFMWIRSKDGKFGKMLESIWTNIQNDPTEFNIWLVKLPNINDETEFRKSITMLKTKYN